jgi:hypothetical protein
MWSRVEIAAEQSFRSKYCKFWGLGTGGVDHVFFCLPCTTRAVGGNGRCRDAAWTDVVIRGALQGRLRNEGTSLQYW